MSAKEMLKSWRPERFGVGFMGWVVCQATATAAEYTVFYPVVQVTVATFMLTPGRQGRKERFVFRSPDGMKGAAGDSRENHSVVPQITLRPEGIII
jgi:hypothetical protein